MRFVYTPHGWMMLVVCDVVEIKKDSRHGCTGSSAFSRLLDIQLHDTTIYTMLRTSARSSLVSASRANAALAQKQVSAAART